MGKRNRVQPAALSGTALLACCLLGPAALGQTTPVHAAKAGETPVTAVEGQSWIRHIRKSFNDTSMGKTWVLGPPPAAQGESAPPWQMKITPEYATQSISLSGSDLYRLSCRGCHGPEGKGAPPEINSIVGPVQATSIQATMERMRRAGMAMSQADVAAMAKDSKAMLLHRLHAGGEHMLPPTLSEAEIPPLVAYLEQLSGVPGAEKRQKVVKESSYRIGEHIVKSACHVCHSATGSNPTPDQIMEGAIPPLSSLATRVSLPEFVRKVTSGAPITMGTPATLYRGRMPVFYYLSQDEASAAYMYLLRYPPRP
jgi:mono/diheme cytochrome c family protein